MHARLFVFVLAIVVNGPTTVYSQGLFDWFRGTSNQCYTQCESTCDPCSQNVCSPVVSSQCASPVYGFAPGQEEVAKVELSKEDKRQIKEIREKLDLIQPDEDPSLQQLREELHEIKNLLKIPSAKRSESKAQMLLARVEAIQLKLDSFRVWRDSTGTKSATARFISTDGEKVYFESAAGRTVKCLMSTLSQADQDWIWQTKHQSNLGSNNVTQSTSNPSIVLERKHPKS